VRRVTEVERELDEGSRFSVLLPAADAAASDQAAHRRRTLVSPGRVLVLDDEAIVRRQLRRSLELRSYTVDEAPDGRTALAALVPPPGGPTTAADVVILDMTMPDLDGAECCDGCGRLGRACRSFCPRDTWTSRSSAACLGASSRVFWPSPVARPSW
jgi:PleD family two-component response regulator